MWNQSSSVLPWAFCLLGKSSPVGLYTPEAFGKKWDGGKDASHILCASLSQTGSWKLLVFTCDNFNFTNCLKLIQGHVLTGKHDSPPQGPSACWPPWSTCSVLGSKESAEVVLWGVLISDDALPQKSSRNTSLVKPQRGRNKSDTAPPTPPHRFPPRRHAQTDEPQDKLADAGGRSPVWQEVEEPPSVLGVRGGFPMEASKPAGPPGRDF